MRTARLDAWAGLGGAPGQRDGKFFWLSSFFTLKTSSLKREDLDDFDDFVACYNPANRNQRQATWSAGNPDGRLRCCDYAELIAELIAQEIAQEIVDDLEAALEQFRLIAGDLEPGAAADLIAGA